MAKSRTIPAEQSRKQEAQADLEWERRENPPWLPTVLPAAAIGTIRAVEGPGRILVDLPEGGTVAARSCVPVAISDVGREGTFVFENGNALLPILVGLLQAPVAESTPPP
ncbi:MAG TPA: DUF6484 domain-containing protein, partial [Fibrobacteria bacterium]|nr:DUF6484 domain-containing protein [Fibrobacteria bacterium]